MGHRPADEIADELRRRIVTGDLAAGSVLSERQLAADLGCGRARLREALRILRECHMVMTPPRRGILVPQLSIVDFQHAYSALARVMEAFMDLAVMRRTEEQLDAMRDVIAKQERASSAGEPYEAMEFGRQFSIQLAESSGNPYFVDMIGPLEWLIARFVYAAFSTGGGADESINDHWKIVAALESHDVDTARRTVSEHYHGGRLRILRTLGLGGDTGEVA